MPWGTYGSVRIKSVNFKVVYNGRHIEELYPRNIVTFSELSWEGRTLTLTDTMTIDMAKGLSYEVPPLALVFRVGNDDSFLGVENMDNLLDRVETQQQMRLSPEKRQALQQKFERECKMFWQMARGAWKGSGVLKTETQQNCILKFG